MFCQTVRCEAADGVGDEAGGYDCAGPTGLLCAALVGKEDRAGTRKAQAHTFDRYKCLALADELADQAIMAMYRRGVINVTRIADVVRAFDEPPHDWGEKTPWRLFNAATYTLSGRVAENPTVTRELHAVIDGVCERLN